MRSKETLIFKLKISHFHHVLKSNTLALLRKNNQDYLTIRGKGIERLVTIRRTIGIVLKKLIILLINK